MEFAALKAFLAVADHGSFSAAADRLFLTQPAVSKRVASLERELDVPLFDRIGHRIVLTEAGRALRPKARHILDELEDSRRLLASLSGRVSGPLSLATSHHIGLHRLPPVLREYSRRYPQVELDIRFMDSEKACTAVAEGRVELAVVTLPDTSVPALVQLGIWDDPMHPAVAPDHPLARHHVATLEQLTGYAAILPEADTFTRHLIEAPFRERGLHLKTGLETNYLETIRMMVSVGLGWSVLPATLFDHDLVRLAVDGLQLQRRLGLVRHKDKTLANAARAFIDCLPRIKYRPQDGI